MANRWKVMSEYCREQRPLLCEEAPEEELYSPQFYRRIRTKNYKGRVRNNLKGAAAVLTRWPNHWSSFLTYLWIGIGMISLSTFIIYNSLFAFSILPSVNLKPTNAIIANVNEKSAVKKSVLPDVYMHVFVSESADINSEHYMPYIEIIANTFLDYKFNFIVVANDTKIGWISAEENNELALNALWTKDKKSIPKESRYYNINIEHVTLSSYLDDSPLRKYWRILPYQLIEFLARTVSIWDKGGVAFNPDILTPKFQHTLYIEKLQKVLNKYAHSNKTICISKLMSPLNKPQKKHRKLNNIRDIINDLESENTATNAFSEQTLAEAENKGVKITKHDRYKTIDTNNVDNTSGIIIESLKTVQNIITNTAAPLYSNEHIHFNTSHNVGAIGTLGTVPNITKMSLLPLLFEFFFHNNADIKQTPLVDESVTNRTRKSALVVPSSDEELSISNKDAKQIVEIKTSYKPVIVPAIDIHNDSENVKFVKTPISIKPEDHFESNRLTIDLKGNIIGTITPCHAFLGTIFSNVVHHNEDETVTDFIIAELTVFCKGLLSTCTGIDLVLL